MKLRIITSADRSGAIGYQPKSMHIRELLAMLDQAFIIDAEMCFDQGDF